MKKDELFLKETRWPNLSPRRAPSPPKKVLSSSVPSFKSTLTAELRSSAVVNRLTELESRKISQAEEEMKRKEKQKRATQRVSAAVTWSNEEYKQKLEEEAERNRERVLRETKEYYAGIKEKYKKLEERPFMFPVGLQGFDCEEEEIKIA
ncbi:hypothetical protein GEMRC1_002885 [Eukaryota sp. GEM-RC1]